MVEESFELARDYSTWEQRDLHFALLKMSELETQSTNLNKEEREPDVVVKENSGRWSSSEHELFLQGLQKYGKDWKAIANDIPTRTVVQVRTHAQKYFQKLNNSTTSRALLSFNRKKIKDNSQLRSQNSRSSYGEKDSRISSSKSSLSTLSSVGADNSESHSSPSSGSTTTATSPVASDTTIISEVTDKESEENTSTTTTSMKNNPNQNQNTFPQTLHIPRSPQAMELSTFNDHEGLFGHSRRHFYQSLSPFEMECNNNHDDMRFVESDCSDIDITIDYQ